MKGGWGSEAAVRAWLSYSEFFVNRELNILSHVFTIAMQDWGLALPSGNPILYTRRPKVQDQRDRRLQGDEESRLLEPVAWAEKQDGSMPIARLIRFALETAMRRGEIAAMQWMPICSDGFCWCPTARRVNLGKRPYPAPQSRCCNPFLAIFWDGSGELSMRPASPGPLPEPASAPVSKTSASMTCAMRRLPASLKKGLNPMQVAAITGHKTLRC